MKFSWYYVPFELGMRSEKVFAPYRKAAIILAQAEQIKKDHCYNDVLENEIEKCSEPEK